MQLPFNVFDRRLIDSGMFRVLKNKGIISNKWLFEFYTKMKGYDKSIQAGTFTIEKVRTNNDIIYNLVYGKPDRKKITFLEGWNIKQVARHLEKEMKFNYSTSGSAPERNLIHFGTRIIEN